MQRFSSRPIRPPPACYRPCGGGPPFVNSRPFTNTNELLRQERGEIDWNLAKQCVF
jgi:hypothetical protein